MASSPWASGPGEILQHGLSLLKKDSDVNRRLAMISIDNAVELMIKTSLGLPNRITGIKIGRDKFREISESFPKLLDALEEHAVDKLDGIDLGEIEWYHRLRNELYHQGNGLTVERDKVEVYSELARLPIKNLFGFDLAVKDDEGMEILGAFMFGWSRLERAANDIATRRGTGEERGRPLAPYELLRRLAADNTIDARTAADLDVLRRLRNELVHGVGDHKKDLNQDVVDRVTRIAERLERIARDLPPPEGGK